MLRAILFDMGGTLDGDGGHWLDRFVDVYAGAGVALPFERVRAAFDHAEKRSAVDEEMASAGHTAMLTRHVSWQFEQLGLTDLALRDCIVQAFEQPVREAARRNQGLLAALATRGLRLGVVSNGCGNTGSLCEDLGYAPYLSVVIDSRRAGIAKPDPAIYTLAAQQLDLLPSAIMMVGDSFERDIVPAKAVGMHTAWLQRDRICPDATRVDVILGSLSDLPAALAARERTVA